MNNNMRNLSLILGLILCFKAVPAFAQAKNCKDDSNYPEISKAELTQLIESKSVFVIDVNSESSFKKSRIPTAIHYETYEDTLAQALPQEKDKLIVAYCGGPRCTAWKKAAREACKIGYTNIKHFKPGIKGWNQS